MGMHAAQPTNQVQLRPGGGGRNAGEMVPASRLPGRRTPLGESGDCPPALPEGTRLSPPPVRLRRPPSHRLSAGAQGEHPRDGVCARPSRGRAGFLQPPSHQGGRGPRRVSQPDVGLLFPALVLRTGGLVWGRGPACFSPSTWSSGPVCHVSAPPHPAMASPLYL